MTNYLYYSRVMAVLDRARSIQGWDEYHQLTDPHRHWTGKWIFRLQPDGKFLHEVPLTISVRECRDLFLFESQAARFPPMLNYLGVQQVQVSGVRIPIRWILGADGSHVCSPVGG